MNDLTSMALFRFYEELNDFLPLEKRKQEVTYSFSGNPSIKDAIEAQGIPHTEVDLIIANSRSIGFDYCLADGDRIAVYPVFEGMDIGPVVQLRPKPLREPRFILDAHLGKLARFLRLLGFDTLYRNDYNDAQIARQSVDLNRIVLTCDRKLLCRRVITHGYCLRSRDALAQLDEVIRRFDLKSRIEPFSRCLVCNGNIEPVQKQEVENMSELKPQTRLCYNDFYRCAGCGKIYWQGSHFGKLTQIVKRFKAGYVNPSP